MPTSRFTSVPTYTPNNGDLVLLLYKNKRETCFLKAKLPKVLAAAASAPEKEGGSKTLFAGLLGPSSILAISQRLDAKYLSQKLQAAKAVSTAIETARKEGLKRVVVMLNPKMTVIALGVQEGAVLGGYAFDQYLSEKAKPLPITAVIPDQPAKLKQEFKAAATTFESVNFARDVLNDPPNTLTPASLAKAYQTFGQASGLKITIWDEKKLRKERCGGILGVGMGAAVKPRLVIGEYHPRGAKRHLCLVGKGVTFDSGGYCLKPGDSQIEMKMDMGGSAMTFAAACAIARLKLPIRITLITPLVENRISDQAYLTSSILTFRNGATAQVDNTDAEGRLILADALCLAAERKPDWIIDSATLTGACVVALGEEIAGIYGNASAFTQKFLKAGEEANEMFWEMPLYKPYREMLKTPIADSKNIGSKWGGSITAALFLNQFVPNQQKWIHCDIAGPGIHMDAWNHLGKGAKGFGVKTLIELAKGLS